MSKCIWTSSWEYQSVISTLKQLFQFLQDSLFSPHPGINTPSILFLTLCLTSWVRWKANRCHSSFLRAGDEFSLSTADQTVSWVPPHHVVTGADSSVMTASFSVEHVCVRNLFVMCSFLTRSSVSSKGREKLTVWVQRLLSGPQCCCCFEPQWQLVTQMSVAWFGKCLYRWSLVLCCHCVTGLIPPTPPTQFTL